MHTYHMTPVRINHPQQSFGEPKPCLCGAPSCRKILSGKPIREEAPQPQLTAKGQQIQREAAVAESFRRRLVGKPLGDISDLVLFFNGRTSKGEMAQVGVYVYIRGGDGGGAGLSFVPIRSSL